MQVSHLKTLWTMMTSNNDSSDDYDDNDDVIQFNKINNNDVSVFV